MARIKNFIKWWLILTVLLEIVMVVFFDPSLLCLEGLFACFVICLFIVIIKGACNVGAGKQPFGLRYVKQQAPPKKPKKKKRGFVSSILNAPHVAAQKGANAVGDKILNFGSGSSDSSYAERRAKKKAADDAAWKEYQEKDKRARERYDKIDEGLRYQYDAEHKYADGSFDQQWAKNMAYKDFDDANNL